MLLLDGAGGLGRWLLRPLWELYDPAFRAGLSAVGSSGESLSVALKHWPAWLRLVQGFMLCICH